MKLGGYEVPGFYHGDARDLLDGLPPHSVQCVVCSPPYWMQREYAGEQATAWADGALCAYGREETPEQYVVHTIEVLDAIRRVLCEDGMLWWNVGDTRNSDPSNYQGGVGQGQRYGDQDGKRRIKRVRQHPHLKVKDLVCVPHRVLLGALEAGWHVRADVVWYKTNAMPDPNPDRPWQAHEHVLQLAPGPRSKWNQVAVRDVWPIPVASYHGAHFATFPLALAQQCILLCTDPGDVVLDPMCGSGTTCAAAEGHGRLWLGFDINPELEAQQRDRTQQRSLIHQLLGCESE